MARTLSSEISAVVDNDLCSGCGACPLIAPSVTMGLQNGFLRPDVSAIDAASDTDAQKIRTFRSACPGRHVPTAPRYSDSMNNPTVGTHLAVWQAWSTDESMRNAGSSGGVLTALSSWLVATGRANRVHAVTESDSPRRSTVPVSIMSKADALAAAGSRYCPASSLAGITEPLTRDDAVTAKPCEISALRALHPADDPQSPLLMSFFCAGTPSLGATDSLLEAHGISREEPLSSLRYRGNGWPGNFSAHTPDGRRADVTYDDSWGKHLGPTQQWRCKLCADGVGESADVVCADFWEADEAGYPVFEEGSGVSALIARTPRGVALVEAAIAESAIAASRITAAQLEDVQPGQRGKRMHMLPRLLGTLLARKRVPRYARLHVAKDLLAPIATYGTARATWGRAKRL